MPVSLVHFFAFFAIYAFFVAYSRIFCMKKRFSCIYSVNNEVQFMLLGTTSVVSRNQLPRVEPE